MTTATATATDTLKGFANAADVMRRTGITRYALMRGVVRKRIKRKLVPGLLPLYHLRDAANFVENERAEATETPTA